MEHPMTDPATTVATKSFTAYGVNVNVKVPYAAGHTVNEAEASTLNQTFVENIRNNTNAKLKKALKDWIEAGAKDLAEGAVNPNNEENFVAGEELSAEIQKYADNYEFGIKKLSNLEPADPVEKEARKIAREHLAVLFKKNSIKIKDVSDDKYEALLAIKAAQPEIVEEAKRRIAIAVTIGNEELDLTGLLNKAADAEPSDPADDAVTDDETAQG